MVAPQYPFPAPPRQPFEVVRWVAEHGAEHGWDGGRLTVGVRAQAAAARQALDKAARCSNIVTCQAPTTGTT